MQCSHTDEVLCEIMASSVLTNCVMVLKVDEKLSHDFSGKQHKLQLMQCCSLCNGAVMHLI